jgi:hypothetical protein
MTLVSELIRPQSTTEPISGFGVDGSAIAGIGFEIMGDDCLVQEIAKIVAVNNTHIDK